MRRTTIIAPTIIAVLVLGFATWLSTNSPVKEGDGGGEACPTWAADAPSAAPSPTASDTEDAESKTAEAACGNGEQSGNPDESKP